MATKPRIRPDSSARTNNEIRALLLQYFYDRNTNATSARGKNGAAVEISDIKKELRTGCGLSQQEVRRNLTYLMSQGWVEEDTVEKSVTAAWSAIEGTAAVGQFVGFD